MALPNRGPLKFLANGDLCPDILFLGENTDFMSKKTGFGPDELGDIEKDVFDILERLPITKDLLLKKGPAGIGCGL
ncbi:MAG: hypothetical protein CM1200mP18_03200 [Gammaproteobacteria bacterium]|nr:MAG: hypothetical protein CM1200mP18_03200 [Gammaproteobacteria bacterium]